MYQTKCNNGIVGLFCQGYGCYYNSDCYDGYCSMYSKCEQRSKPSYIAEIDNQFRNTVNGLPNNGTVPAETPVETEKDTTDSDTKEPSGSEQPAKTEPK